MESGEIILGIDPSFWRTGWVAVRQGGSGRPDLLGCGVVSPPKAAARARNLHWIQVELLRVLDVWRPSLAVLELPGEWMHRSGSRRHSVEMMAMARGVMVAACASRDVEVCEVQFQRVRQILLGKHNAGATDVIAFVRAEGLAVPPDRKGNPDLDVFNAALMALYGVSRTE
jgi:Holliday junction resolvasome RuvABC endonuclease subunit